MYLLTWILLLLVQDVFSSINDCPEIKKVYVVADYEDRFNHSGCTEDNVRFKNRSELRLSCTGDDYIITKLRTQFIQSIPTLKHIVIINCPLTVIETSAFKDLPELKKLSVIYVEHKPSPTLVLKKNMFHLTPSLSAVVLGGFKIEKIEAEAFSNLPQLRGLSLAHNKLEYIDAMWFNNITNIIGLDLKDNNIKEVNADDFKHLPKLEQLFLSHNEISFIAPRAFNELKNLEVLALDENKITALSVDVFPDPSKLSLLVLMRNRLNYLTEDFLEKTLKNNVTLNISLNPIVCSCLDFILNWMHRNNISSELFFSSHPNDTSCGSPLSPPGTNGPYCAVDSNNPNVCEMAVKPTLTKQFLDTLPPPTGENKFIFY